MTNNVDNPGPHITKAAWHQTGYGGNRVIALNHHRGDDTAGVVGTTDASTGQEKVSEDFIIPKVVEPPDCDSPEAKARERTRIGQLRDGTEVVEGEAHKTVRTAGFPANPTKPGGVDPISVHLRNAATIPKLWKRFSLGPGAGGTATGVVTRASSRRYEWLSLAVSGIQLQVHRGLLEMPVTKPITFEMSKQSKRKQGMCEAMTVLIPSWRTASDGSGAYHMARHLGFQPVVHDPPWRGLPHQTVPAQNLCGGMSCRVWGQNGYVLR